MSSVACRFPRRAASSNNKCYTRVPSPNSSTELVLASRLSGAGCRVSDLFVSLVGLVGGRQVCHQSLALISVPLLASVTLLALSPALFALAMAAPLDILWNFDSQIRFRFVFEICFKRFDFSEVRFSEIDSHESFLWKYALAIHKITCSFSEV